MRAQPPSLAPPREPARQHFDTHACTQTRPRFLLIAFVSYATKRAGHAARRGVIRVWLIPALRRSYSRAAAAGGAMRRQARRREQAARGGAFVSATHAKQTQLSRCEAGAHHCNVVAVQQDSVQLRHAPPLGRALATRRRAASAPASGARALALGFVRQRPRAARCTLRRIGRALLGHVLKHHVDVHVEAAQRAHQLLLPLHNHLKTRGKGVKRRTKPSTALHRSLCARSAATLAVLYSGARFGGRATRSGRAVCACDAESASGQRAGTHPDAAAHALVHQLAGQQVRHVAAVLLSRQRHGGGREAVWRRRGGARLSASATEASPLALPRGADAGRSAPARLSCAALPACTPR